MQIRIRRVKAPDEVTKATCSLEAIESSVATSLGVDPPSGACNAQQSTLSPAMGRKCGRREREAVTGSGRTRNPSRARGRNGGRHPGPQDAVSLRGMAEECGSWSVRHVGKGLVPVQSAAPMTTGVLWKNEEGNVVSVRQAHALVARDA